MAAVDGRASEAIAAFGAARASLLRLGLNLEAAMAVVHAATLLPDDPEVRAWASEARPLLVELRATTRLGQLDAALAASEAPQAAAARSEVRARG